MGKCVSIQTLIMRFAPAIILLLSSAIPGAIAQGLYPTESSRFTVADGLPQSYVSGIEQDRHGFMWIGTRDGLAGYDGRSIKVFRHIQRHILQPFC